MNTQSEFLYQLSNNLEYESIDSNDSYLNSIFKDAEKYYFSNTLVGINVKEQLILGNFAFYLLDIPNLDFDKDTLSKIELINCYLSRCITNDKYCNNKIFLAFVRDILKMHKIPKCDIYVSNYYKKSDNSTNIITSEKLDLMLDNIEEIKLNKDYTCNGIIDLIVISIFEIFSQGFSIKRCKNCHKYFFNKNSNKYCSYASPQKTNKSCYEYCTNLSYLEKRDNDPIRSKYNKISNMLRSRYRYYGKESDRQVLSNFGDDYLNKIEQLNNGSISKEDVLEFLNLSEQNFKEQYKRRKKDGSSGTNKK